MFVENYKNYKYYNIYMEMTTIAIPKELKEKLRNLGMMGENYSDVIVRLVEAAREKMLHDFIMSEEGCVPVEDALKRARERWPE